MKNIKTYFFSKPPTLYSICFGYGQINIFALNIDKTQNYKNHYTQSVDKFMIVLLMEKKAK